VSKRQLPAKAKKAMSRTAPLRKAPGPPGHLLIGNLLEFRRDVLGALLEGRETYGDIVRFRLGPNVVHLVANPADIEHVLLARHENYDKQTRSSAKIRSVTGQGLLTTSGDFWLRQRRLTQPVFARERLGAFLGIMTSATAATLERWDRLARRGESLDVASEMMRLTCTIVAKALLGVDVAADLDTIETSAAVLMAHAWRRLERIVDPGVRLPTPANLRFRRALARLDAIVDRIINQRRAADRGGNDLLTMLLSRTDDETGQSMSDAELRNETITLLLAGHETTANALTWTWYLLARHDWAARRARDEIMAVLGDRLPTLDDLARLEYTTRVLRESLRLYPPIWIMERRALADDTIDGFHIPGGSSVVISPYVTHRHPSFWERPEQFDVDRFLPQRAAGRAPHAYLPFGGGQRLCIGNNFAMTEALIILAMVLSRYRLALVPGHPVEPKPGITLRAAHGLLVTLHPW
jgi:cytochrome P450